MLFNFFALDAATNAPLIWGIPVAEFIIGILLMVIGVFLVIAVLLQSSKDKGLSGSISGGSDSFFARSKTQTRDKILSRLTLVFSIIFAILVIALYVVAA